MTQQPALQVNRGERAVKVVLLALAMGTLAFMVATIFGDWKWGLILGAIVITVNLLAPWVWRRNRH